MRPELRCSRCGEEDELRGASVTQGIEVTCGRCGYQWLRDEGPRCATCGGGDIVRRPRTMTAYARGNQMSVHGWHEVDLCTGCDAEAIDRSTSSGGPLAADYVSAAEHRRPKP